jgi:hypothetical protein
LVVADGVLAVLDLGAVVVVDGTLFALASCSSVFFAAALVCDELPPDDSPQAARPKLASMSAASTAAAGVRSMCGVVGIELLFRWSGCQ